jgi:hypothetical protein
VNPEQYPVTDNGDDVEADSWLIAVKKFFSWCLQMAKHDLNRDLERWRADALNEALEQNKISSNNK